MTDWLGSEPEESEYKDDDDDDDGQHTGNLAALHAKVIIKSKKMPTNRCETPRTFFQFQAFFLVAIWPRRAAGRPLANHICHERGVNDCRRFESARL